MFVDFVLNGQAHGEVGEHLAGVRFDPGLLRPYYDSKGNRCVTVNTGQLKADDKGVLRPVYRKVRIEQLRSKGIDSPVLNATSLRRLEWTQLDSVVVKAARQRLKAWTDLASANSTGGFNAMAKMTYEYEAMSDPGEALVDMEGLADGRNDMPLFKLRSLPLPITHSGFWMSSRRLAVSRNSGTPLDTTMGEAAGRRVAEMVEKTLIGVETGASYGYRSTGITAHDSTTASQVYGYINFPYRLTKTDMTTPTGSNPEAIVQDFLEAREQLYAAGFYGPFMVYHSTDYDQHLDNDYARLGGNNANMTLRDRLRKIEGIQDVKRLDYLTAANSHAFTTIFVQMTSDVCRAINGMGITTVQWESQGGMRLNFKVMCIQVPLIQADYSGNCGLLHARTA